MLSGVQPTVDIPVPAGKVTPTGDLAARWGWLKPGQDWRNLGLTPQFDVNGPLAAQMWEAETGQHVDGVLAVDVEALHQLLEVTGPVTLPSGEEVFRHRRRPAAAATTSTRASPMPRRTSRPRSRRAARSDWGRWPRPPSTPSSTSPWT